jgi:hypothetical protein
MATLTGETIAGTYKDLLQVSNSNSGVDSTSRYISDGEGTDSVLSISTTKIGIGTASPEDLLDIRGTGIAASTQPTITLSTPDDSAIIAGSLLGKIVWSADDNSGSQTREEVAAITYKANETWNAGNREGYFSFGASNTGAYTDDIMVVGFEGGVGRVGIGTTTPGVPLHIQKASTTGGVPVDLLRLEMNESSSVDQVRGEGPAIHFYVGEEGGSESGCKIAAVRESATDATADASLVFLTSADDASPSEKMRIDKDGNVGIGTTTPGALLEISSSTDNKPNIYLTNNSTTADDQGGNLIFRTGDGPIGGTQANLTDDDVIGDIRFSGCDISDDAFIDAAMIRGVINGTPGTNDMPGELSFWTNSGADSITQKMCILANGNVGIGTATPTTILEVVGVGDGIFVNMADNSHGDSALRLQRCPSGRAQIDLEHQDGTKLWKFGMISSTGGAEDFWFSDGTDIALRLYHEGDVTFNPAGNVGIGTTSPDTKLEVVGSFAANGPSSTFVTFADGDATPSVATGNIFKHHASTQTINMFDGGICGQIITVISTAAITYDFNASNLKCGSADIVTASGDVTMWVFDGTNWYLLSWMDVSADLADGSAGGF